MPVTVHKILLHGCDVIKYFDIPIGMHSEEALEARAQDTKKLEKVALITPVKETELTVIKIW